MRPMMGRLNKLAGWGVAVILAAVLPYPVQAARMKDARVWAGPEYTRVVLDANGPLDYTINQKDGQIVVNLRDSDASADFSAPAAQGLYRGISQVRSGNNLLLTANVDPASRLKSFVLKPAGSDDYRLVLDLYPGNGTPGSDKPGSDKSLARTVTPSFSNPTHSRRVAAEQAAAMLNGQRAVVVAIDAGHGGKDQGAHGPGGTLEKNVTLAVARDLAREINSQPGMNAVLTRSSDVFVPLKERYEIARKHNADLFVSIHADSFTGCRRAARPAWRHAGWPMGKTART